MPAPLTWLLYAGAVLAGVIGHEVAHWIVWRLAGRRPSFGLLTVTPRAGPTWTTTADRIAAAAPYLCGLSFAVAGVLLGSVLWIGFGWGLFRVPSRVDVATMRGRAEWQVTSSEQSPPENTQRNSY